MRTFMLLQFNRNLKAVNPKLLPGWPKTLKLKWGGHLSCASRLAAIWKFVRWLRAQESFRGFGGSRFRLGDGFGDASFLDAGQWGFRTWRLGVGFLGLCVEVVAFVRPPLPGA